MIWAVESSLHGEPFRAYPGYLFVTRAKARLNLKWARQSLPGVRFRIRAYERR